MEKQIEILNVPKRVLFTGEEIPAVGLGTFGSDKYSAEQVSEAVYGAIKYGYRLVDCAAVYQNEKQIGEVLKKVFQDKVVTREELFITSKVWNDRHREVEAACSQSLEDLGLSTIDLYFVHWPFPNYHAPGCDGDSRNPDSKPFSVEEFMDTWRQCERLVDKGLVRYIGMSNMTVKKLEQVLPLCHIQPERDRTAEDIADIEMETIRKIAEVHNVHPAVICLKWAVQRGMIPIPFSVKEPQYIANLRCATEDPLTEEEMEKIRKSDRNCRLIKGQVFLWSGASDWKALWDEE